MTVTSNGAGSPQSIALSGTATAAVPILSLSATALTFGTIITGMSSAPQMITATNLGSAPLSLSTIAASGDFTQTSGVCAASVAPRASCQIFVTFGPSATGTRTGTLSVTNNTSAGTQTVGLTGAGAAPVTFAGASFQVTVQAGTKPIASSSLQLYAAGTTGNGSAATALLPVALSTLATGTVTIPGGYVCPAANSPLYVVSRGGTVNGAASANPNIALMTAIGACNGIAAGAKFISDEATSVAAIEALAQFYTVGGSIGATASNLIGLTNAFATAATLADPVAGTSPGLTLPSNATSPAARVNSLANLLNACAVAPSNCSSLYTSTAQGTTLATNTLDALYFLVKHPTTNVSALYLQTLATSAYTPALTGTPTDWTIFINYSGGGMNSPSGIGVDSTGSVWVSSYFSSASKFSPIGAPAFANGITGDGLNNSYALAIDLSDNVWIPNEQPFTSAGIGSVSELSSVGTSLAGNGYINGGMNYPLSVAIDNNGTVWVVDYGNSHLTLLNSSGTPLSGPTGYTTPLFAFPVAVAVDANHYGWIVNQSSNFLTRVAPDGSSFTNYNCCNLASGIALDQQDNAWVANYFGNTVSLVTNAGNVVSGSYDGGGSINHPQGIAVDGGGSLWVANFRVPYLTELAGATSSSPGAPLSPVTGIGGDAGLLEAYAIALDASGNVWVSNQGNNTVTKFIGLAVPVKTPLSGLPQLP
jgi:streptogramin lyase